MKKTKILNDILYVNDTDLNKENFEIVKLYNDKLNINNTYLCYKYEENTQSYIRTIGYDDTWYFDGTITTESLSLGNLNITGYSYSLSDIYYSLPNISIGSITPDNSDNLSIEKLHIK